MQDVRAFEIASGRQAEILDGDLGGLRNPFFKRRQGRAQFVNRPDEEFALFAFAVGIGRAVESAGRRGHFAQNVIADIFGNRPEKRLAGDLPGMEIQAA